MSNTVGIIIVVVMAILALYSMINTFKQVKAVLSMNIDEDEDTSGEEENSVENESSNVEKADTEASVKKASTKKRGAKAAENGSKTPESKGYEITNLNSELAEISIRIQNSACSKKLRDFALELVSVRDLLYSIDGAQIKSIKMAKTTFGNSIAYTKFYKEINNLYDDALDVGISIRNVVSTIDISEFSPLLSKNVEKSSNYREIFNQAVLNGREALVEIHSSLLTIQSKLADVYASEQMSTTLGVKERAEEVNKKVLNDLDMYKKNTSIEKGEEL